MILDSHALAASPEPFADILDDLDVFDVGSRAAPRVRASQGSDCLALQQLKLRGLIDRIE